MPDIEKLTAKAHNRLNRLGLLFFVILAVFIYRQFHSDNYFEIANGFAIAFGYYVLIHILVTLDFKLNLGKRTSESEKYILSEERLLNYSPKKKIKYLVIILLFLGGVYLLSYKIKQWDQEEKTLTEQRESNPGYSIAEITQVEERGSRQGSSNYRIHYEFIVDNTRYQRYIMSGFSKKSWVNLFPIEKGDRYKLQYEKGNIENHKFMEFEPVDETKEKFKTIVKETFNFPSISSENKATLLDSLESKFGFIGVIAFYGMDKNLSGTLRNPIKNVKKHDDFINLIERFEDK